jgi:membrane protein implicated in regulation of membrane protease activity
MAPYVYWFLLALALIMLEMATGTFYMLVVGLALAVGGFAAYFGLSFPTQLTLSGLAGVAGTLILRRIRRDKVSAESNQSLDIGQAVQSVSWLPNGYARAIYRGAEWAAEAESSNTPREGTFYIKALRGSTLILTHHKPKN